MRRRLKVELCRPSVMSRFRERGAGDRGLPENGRREIKVSLRKSKKRKFQDRHPQNSFRLEIRSGKLEPENFLVYLEK